MLKTSFKVLMLFVLLVIVAVATGLATYNITQNMMEEQQVQAQQTSSTQQTTEKQRLITDESISSQGATEEREYYLVRLQGDALEIYVAYSGEEEFLYSREVYKKDLSHSDLKMLRNGVVLKSASELTAFIENFTS